MNFYTPNDAPLEINDAGRINEKHKSILLIGDSISIGYTPTVRTLLKDEFNVIRPDANCGNTSYGLEQIDSWLGDKHWDVIHFNWGLHDLCYRHPDAQVYGNRDKINGKISVPINQYNENLTSLVKILGGTGAALVWASTTMIPEGEAGRKVGDEVIYNNIAKEIMGKNKIPINDLYALTCSLSSAMFTSQGDVHFTKEGYRIIGQQVVTEIQKTICMEEV